MFKNNPDLYPTPEWLVKKMLNKVDFRNQKIKNILEPSAGLGNIIDVINSDINRNSSYNICAIELDNKCRNVLLSKNVKVIDSDFLTYNGLEQFDLIIANFPFSDGDSHLHKALDVLFSGQIVCLLNAETIKNPYSNSRKDLVSKLNKLDAKIEYIQNAFSDADRKTNVETALIYISKIRDVETELFNDIKSSEDSFDELKESFEVATKDNIGNIVKRYNQDKETVTNQIMDFYKNYKKVSKYLTLAVIGEDIQRHSQNVKQDTKELTEIMKDKLNNFVTKLKRDYWLEAMNLNEVKSRLTSQKKQELQSELNKYCNMDFTENNIKIFIDNLMANYPKMIDEAIEYMFDKFTQYAFRDGRNTNNEYSKNIHLFNGWKTNTAFKVNKKIILPFRAEYGNRLYSEKQDFLNDIDMVFNYFDDKGLENNLLEYVETNGYKQNILTTNTAEIVQGYLYQGETKNIKTRYFTITFYLKGTVHLVFNDLDMLRRFNIFVGKKRNYLPSDYGYTEKQEFKDFEPSKEYKQIGTELAIDTKKVLMLN